jgi:hypothetical protein
MLFRVEIVIRNYCENSTKFIDTSAVRGLTAEYLMLKQVVLLVTAGLWSVDDDGDDDDCDLAEGLAEWLRYSSWNRRMLYSICIKTCENMHTYYM